MAAKRVFVSIGISLAMLGGVLLLIGAGQPLAARAASAPTVFTIAPGDAERVPFDRDDGVCTLAEAVEAANDQGVSDPPLNDCGSASSGLNVIELQAGDYDLTAHVATINGGRTATFNIVTPIRVQGVTSDTTTIRRTDTATDTFRFFHVGSNGALILEDLTLTGGYANDGSGGGAVYVFPTGLLTMTSTSLTSNTARFGGALYNGGETWIDSSSIVNNSASENDASLGGGIYNTNRLHLTASTVTSNRSTQDGGGMYISGTGSGAVVVTASSIVFNQSNSDFTGAGHGGGIYHATGQLTVTLSTLASNEALPDLKTLGGSNGGGLFVADTLDMNLTFLNLNFANDGGAMYVDEPGTAVVTRTLFLTNLAGESGGAIYNAGGLALDNTVVWLNTATQGNGGGLYNDTPDNSGADIRNSTFYDNVASSGDGGGIYNVAGGTAWMTLSNTTVADNEALGNGGGIANGQEGQIVVASSTIANNVAGNGDGGGFWNSDPITENVRIRNTILTGNTSANTVATGNCGGGLTSQGYNLESMATCPLTAVGDITGGDAALASLAPADPLQVLQGNITPAFDLQSGSQAINAGNPTACYDALNLNNNDQPLPTDQWGNQRIKDGRCDIGSVETNTPTAVTLAGLSAASGVARTFGGWVLALVAAAGALAALAMRARWRTARSRW